MSSDFLSDDLDNDEYAALLRGLQWIEGFGVFFVECTPAQAQALILSLSAELADKKIQTLSLDVEIKDLRECISKLDQSAAIEVLFLTGLEKSFTPYIKEGYGGEGNYYKEDSVPPVLGRLNLDREAFKQAFPQLAIVCILPKFGIKYFIRRAPDFFDWRSGLFCFTTEKQILEKVLKEKTSVDYDSYLQLSETERQERLLELYELIDEPNCTSKDKAVLYLEIAIILTSLKRNEKALANCDKTIAIKADYYHAWFWRGLLLDELGQKEEALASYDKAIALEPNNSLAWFNRGNVLGDLGQKKEALASLDKAIAIQPDFSPAWHYRGHILIMLGQKKEALASYDKAIVIKPDYYQVWFNRGVVLNNLGQKEEALASYNKVITIKPDYYKAWCNRGYILNDLGQKEEAFVSYYKAIDIEPDDYLAWFGRGNVLYDLGQKEEALVSYDKAIAIKPDYYDAWFNRGYILSKLGQKEEALANYDKAIAIKSDDHRAWSNRGDVFWKQKKLVEAAESFATVLAIKPDDLSTLGNDIELALVQQDFSRMQQRITAISPLLKSDEEYFVIVPFLQWLASPTNSPQTVITAIQQFEANTPIDWDFEDMQPAIARLTPAQQQIAQTFIAFFQNKIDFETLQQQITV